MSVSHSFKDDTGFLKVLCKYPLCVKKDIETGMTEKKSPAFKNVTVWAYIANSSYTK